VGCLPTFGSRRIDEIGDDSKLGTSDGRTSAALRCGDSEFYTWMRATILDITGVDMSADGGPPPALVIDWTA
jgi:hypothetical protein